MIYFFTKKVAGHGEKVTGHGNRQKHSFLGEKHKSHGTIIDNLADYRKTRRTRL